MAGNRQQRRRAGKPQGMSYADVLAQKRLVKESVEKAARDTTVQLESDTHTQRAMWLMAISIHDAFGIGPERMKRFFDVLQENSDWVAQMEADVDLDYAYEKLRCRAGQVTGMEIEYLYEKDALAAELKHTKESAETAEALHR